MEYITGGLKGMTQFWSSKDESSSILTRKQECLNILVLGDSQVGKSTLLETYCGYRAPEEPAVQTVGVDVHVKISSKNGTVIPCNYYDVSGDLETQPFVEFFVKNLFRTYIEAGTEYPLAAIYLVFSCSNKNSIRSMKKWANWVYSTITKLILSTKASDQAAFDKRVKETPVIVIGHKVDEIGLDSFCPNDLLQLSSEPQSLCKATTDKISKELNQVLGIQEAENLLFTTSETNFSITSMLLDRVVLALNDKKTARISGPDRDFTEHMLGKCLRGREFAPEDAHPLVKAFRKLFKKQEIELPL